MLGVIFIGVCVCVVVDGVDGAVVVAVVSPVPSDIASPASETALGIPPAVAATRDGVVLVFSEVPDPANDAADTGRLTAVEEVVVEGAVEEEEDDKDELKADVVVAEVEACFLKDGAEVVVEDEGVVVIASLVAEAEVVTAALMTVLVEWMVDGEFVNGIEVADTVPAPAPGGKGDAEDVDCKAVDDAIDE